MRCHPSLYTLSCFSTESVQDTVVDRGFCVTARRPWFGSDASSIAQVWRCDSQSVCCWGCVWCTLHSAKTLRCYRGDTARICITKPTAQRSSPTSSTAVSNRSRATMAASKALLARPRVKRNKTWQRPIPIPLPSSMVLLLLLRLLLQRTVLSHKPPQPRIRAMRLLSPRTVAAPLQSQRLTFHLPTLSLLAILRVKVSHLPHRAPCRTPNLASLRTSHPFRALTIRQTQARPRHQHHHHHHPQPPSCNNPRTLRRIPNRLLRASPCLSESSRWAWWHSSFYTSVDSKPKFQRATN